MSDLRRAVSRCALAPKLPATRGRAGRRRHQRRGRWGSSGSSSRAAVGSMGHRGEAEATVAGSRPLSPRSANASPTDATVINSSAIFAPRPRLAPVTSATALEMSMPEEECHDTEVGTAPHRMSSRLVPSDPFDHQPASMRQDEQCRRGAIASDGALMPGVRRRLMGVQRRVVGAGAAAIPAGAAQARRRDVRRRAGRPRPRRGAPGRPADRRGGPQRCRRWQS